MDKRLTKSVRDKNLCGVCGGLAEYFDCDPTIVRILYCIATFCLAAFPGVLIYIILALIMPKGDC